MSALLSVFDNLMNMIDSSTTVDMIYPDLSKAFDKVNHSIVLHKLRDIGSTGNLAVWFNQFLSDMTQFVRLPGGVSKDTPVLRGVPLGTVLGPLLFIIMISDINKYILSYLQLLVLQMILAFILILLSLKTLIVCRHI